MISSVVASYVYVRFGETTLDDLRKGPLGVGLPKKAKWIQFRFSLGGTLMETRPAGVTGPGLKWLSGKAKEEADRVRLARGRRGRSPEAKLTLGVRLG